MGNLSSDTTMLFTNQHWDPRTFKMGEKHYLIRNIERFPEDFMFELSKSEFKNWRTQFATSNRDKIGLR